ncbi:hypothetical protein SAMN04489806_1221 [Paramicrobacterium humi]|uniref:Uncharacterized protein n=1 Tax=Paramicrobacterium humi TaxID=640635 RepID=A0A1H4KNI8_9MICO|nr:hypothetical protein SAMN04489806_1221 [Microbacterium humi]
MSAPVSAAAGRSIRFFSIVVWIAGTITAMVLASVMLSDYLINPRTGELGFYGAEARNPWSDESPQRFERDGSVWRGSGSGYIELTAADDEPIELTATRIDAFTTFRIWPSSQIDVPAADRRLPLALGYLGDAGDTTLVVPPGERTQLWVQSTGDWEFAARRITSTPIEDTLSGSGNAYLAYRGDALSARFEHHGTGIFFVSLVSVRENERPIIETDEVDSRVSWDEAPLVVFVIEADTGDGEWTVTIDELAGPTQTTTPTEQEQE